MASAMNHVHHLNIIGKTIVAQAHACTSRYAYTHTSKATKQVTSRIPEVLLCSRSPLVSSTEMLGSWQCETSSGRAPYRGSPGSRGPVLPSTGQQHFRFLLVASVVSRCQALSCWAAEDAPRQASRSHAAPRLLDMGPAVVPVGKAGVAVLSIVATAFALGNPAISQQ